MQITTFNPMILTSIDNSESIIKLFEESGYNVTLTLVNAKDYGVAEERKRVFYIGFRKDLGIDFKFPVGSTVDDKKKLTLRDTIWICRK